MDNEIEFTVKLGGGVYKSNSDEILYPMYVTFKGETKTSYLNNYDRLKLLDMVEELKEAFESFEIPDD